MADTLARWRRRSWPDRALLCEAMVMLALARIAVALLPFRTVAWIAGATPVPRPRADPERSALLGRVSWAVIACARRAPFRAVCFQQGMAAQIMLRRRGVPSILYYGVARAGDPERGIEAHVWVRDGETYVVGGAEAPRFAVLASFPPGAADPSIA